MKKACLSLSLNNEVVQVYMLRVRRTRSYSVRQWVNKEEEETETTGVRRAELGRAGAGRGRFQFFHRVNGCTACGRSGTTPFLPGGSGSGGQAPDTAMPPCVWRWNTGRGLPHLARPPVPLKRSASIRPSVGQSSAAGGGRLGEHMHAHTHTSAEENNTKTTQPITLALLSLS